MVSKSSCWQPHNFSRMCSHLKIFNESLIPRLKLQCPTQDVRWYFVGDNKRGYSNTRLYSKRYGISAYRSYVHHCSKKYPSRDKVHPRTVHLNLSCFLSTRNLREHLDNSHCVNLCIPVLTQNQQMAQNFMTVQRFPVFLKLSSIWCSSTLTGNRLKNHFIKIC